ncbi:hypothetical protein Pelo_152 [Pelomyxa schiedti]|nr:hypothetical protein Pelo_152 [Pelomyxa schiedti]
MTSANCLPVLRLARLLTSETVPERKKAISEDLKRISAFTAESVMVAMQYAANRRHHRKEKKPKGHYRSKEGSSRDNSDPAKHQANYITEIPDVPHTLPAQNHAREHRRAVHPDSAARGDSPQQRERERQRGQQPPARAARRPRPRWAPAARPQRGPAPHNTVITQQNFGVSNDAGFIISLTLQEATWKKH